MPSITPPTSVEIFQHVRVAVGIVIGLSIARLLNGAARFIQHPTENPVYLVHISWVLMMLLTLIHFWWWEFDLREITQWNFETYLFVIFYAILLFLLCTLLFPDTIREYSGYADYFISRRKWFFSIFAITILFDVIDTRLKGQAHFALFEREYLLRAPIYLTLCGIAIWTPNRRFHAAFVIGSLIYEASWIIRLFNTLN